MITCLPGQERLLLDDRSLSNLLTREDTPSDCIAATLMNVSAEAVLDIYQRYIRGVSLAFLTVTFAAK